MRIIKPQSALLSNHEVLLHFRSELAEYTGTDGTGRQRSMPPGLKRMLKDGIQYLAAHDANHPAGPLEAKHPKRPETLYIGPHSLGRRLKPKYIDRLKKVEFLQLFNLRPTTQVELTLIIQESHVRFTEEELDDLLEIIKSFNEELEVDIPEGVEDQVIKSFNEELEVDIPEGVEDQIMDKITDKMLDAPKKRQGGGRRKA